MKPRIIIRIILGIRMVLWAISVAVTIRWIYWSFKLYDLGYMDVHSYATKLRPILYEGIVIAFVCIVICFILRSISDKIRRKHRL